MLTITTTYRPHAASNVGKVVASSLGRQRTVRCDPARSADANHRAAATALAEALHDLGAVAGRTVEPVDSNDSGTVRLFRVVTS
jgi:hypothetical protein